MSQLEVKILHQDFVLTCPEGHESQLLEAAERVDQQLEKMRHSSKLRSRERLGILLAVNLAYENLELRSQLQALQKQLISLQNTADTASSESSPLERLHHLEAQALADQQAAQQLLQRLDHALQTTASQTSDIQPNFNQGDDSLDTSPEEGANQATASRAFSAQADTNKN